MKKILLTIMLLIGISYISSSQTIDENGKYSLPKNSYFILKIHRCGNLYEMYLSDKNNQIYKVISDRDFKTKLSHRKYKKLEVWDSYDLTLQSIYSRSFGKDKVSMLPITDYRTMHIYGKCHLTIDEWTVPDIFESPEIKDLYYIGDK